MARIKKIFHRNTFRLVFTGIAILFALPLPWGILTGAYIWFSPFIMLNSIFALKSMVLLNSLGCLMLIVTFFKKRWFCQYLCPVGFACDSISSVRKNKKAALKKLPPIGKWLAISSLVAALFGVPLFIIFDPLAIFHGFFNVFSKDLSLATILSFIGLPILLAIHFFLPNIWCSKLCPLGAFQDEVHRIFQLFKKKPNKEKVKLLDKGGRRFFISSGFGLLAGLFIPRVLKKEKKTFFRPPGSINKHLFNVMCIRCGNCVKACPTDIIKQRKNGDDILSWMTPEISYENGYCSETCNKCGTVCPSGSISPFSIEAKKQLKIGLSVVNYVHCRLSLNRECDRCKASCKYDAISYQRNKNSLLSIPVVDPDKCVGCGACSIICPESTIKMHTH